MKVKYFVLYCFLIVFSLNTIKAYANGSVANAPNEISDFYKNLIETEEMKPLSLLETIDIQKYDLVNSFLSENENIDDYYYEISICVRIDEKTQQFLSPEGYSLIKELPEYTDLQIEYIEYAIWYYEAFFNKYRGTRGDPTGKCFSIRFNNNYEFMGRHYWR
jgi:hypothetical protein